MLSQQSVAYSKAAMKALQGVLQESIPNFEGQYPIFSFKKNHQIYTNITP